MRKEIRKKTFVFALAFCLFLLFVENVYAQAVQQVNSSSSMTFDETNDPHSPVYLEALRERQIFRQEEIKRNGFKWYAWTAAPKAITDFVLSRTPKLKIELQNEALRIDYAVDDIDGDNKPDVILNYWSIHYCGRIGCQYEIYFADKKKLNIVYSAHKVAPVKGGIVVDGVRHDL